MRFILYCLCFSSLAIVLVGCKVQSVVAQAQPETILLFERVSESEPLTVFAAASLTEPFSAIADTFEANHQGVEVLLNFAGSQALQLQIEQGARADVFASADVQHTEALLEANLLESPVVFSHNRLVVVVPASNPASVKTLVDLTKPGLKLVLAGPDVPVGRYARRALEKLNSHPDLPSGFSVQVLENVVSEENNVKAVLAKIQLGEADAGIVYASDVVMTAVDNFITVAIPPEYNIVANYPIALLSDSTRRELAQQFIDFVLSPEGQTILADHGFQPVQLQAAGSKP